MLKIISQNYLSFKLSKLLEYPKGKDCVKILEKNFTYKNPDWVEAVKWGRATWNIEEYVFSFHRLGDELKFYKGCEKRLAKILDNCEIPFEIVDFTITSDAITLFTKSKFQLRDEQVDFNTTFLDYARVQKVKNAIALANTSFGKTITSIFLAKELQQVTTVLVHTTFAQEQWIKTLTEDFFIDAKDIGGAGGVFKKPKLGKINVGLYHSMSKREINLYFRDKTGFLIIDECQLASIRQFTDAITAFKPRYQLAMTAGSKDGNEVTQLFRKDGKQFHIFDLCGEVIFRSKDEESNSKIFAEIFSTPTGFRPDDPHPSKATTSISRIYERNVMIAKRAVVAHRNGRIVIIFVERKEQAAVLAKFLSGKFRVGLLIGAVPPKEIAELDISDKAKEFLLNNEPKEALKDVTEKCLKRELDFVIATQKGEVGLSVETFGHGIITTAQGNNLERFNQTKGRLERKHKEGRLELYGEKPTPYVEIIVDDYASSRNSWSAIKAQYAKYIIKNPYNKEKLNEHVSENRQN